MTRWTRSLEVTWRFSLALALGAACARVDDPSKADEVVVATSALTACTTTADCAGGQSCCNGFCKNLVAIGSNGKIDYGCYAAQKPDGTSSTPPSDNVVPDFSYAGYKMGGVKLPHVPSLISLAPHGNGADDSWLIQQWLDWCGQQGTPCAVYLTPGTHIIDTPLKIKHSNTVLRGALGGLTTLLSRIPSAHTLIRVGAETLPSYPAETDGTQAPIGGRVPVGAKQLVVNGGGPWTGCTASTPCDVVVVRTPNTQWVIDTHMNQVNEPWQPSAFIIKHVRRVVGATALGGGPFRLTLDIPMVDAIDPRYGGGAGATGIGISPGYVAKIGDGGFIEGSGVEDLTIRSTYHDTAPEDCGNGLQCSCGHACTSNSHCPNNGTCGSGRGSCRDKPCTTSSQCGGGTCTNFKCVGGTCGACDCPCTDPNTSCTDNTGCASGYECRDRRCQCAGETGSCANSRKLCRLEDGDWRAIDFRRVKNSWVRRVTVHDYGMSAASLNSGSSFNTVEEVAHIKPQSPISPTGLPNSSHRYSFSPGDGVGNLFQRVYTQQSRHSFVAGTKATGPHVWLDAVAHEALSDQGPHLRWATGLLYDNVFSQGTSLSDGSIRVHNAKNGGTSHGWTGAQVMLWNNEGKLVCDGPAGGMNWVVGGIGVQEESASSPEEPFGIWQFSKTTVKPRSLYLQQLKDRLGQAAVDNVTTPEQRNGRLFKALKKWKGQGLLASWQDDPTCASGTPDTTGSACCPGTCAVCGGSGLPAECRAGPIVAGTRSCLEYPAPCFRPDPDCEWGLRSGSGTYCCPKSCTQCGGSGQPAECRTGNVTRSCGKYPGPCKMVDPECASGVIAATDFADPTPEYCCSGDCSQCGGIGCGAAGTACCVGSLTSTCDASMPACLM
jgi:hypothetical protein